MRRRSQRPKHLTALAACDKAILAPMVRLLAISIAASSVRARAGAFPRQEQATHIAAATKRAQFSSNVGDVRERGAPNSTGSIVRIGPTKLARPWLA